MQPSKTASEVNFVFDSTCSHCFFRIVERRGHSKFWATFLRTARRGAGSGEWEAQQTRRIDAHFFCFYDYRWFVANHLYPIRSCRVREEEEQRKEWNRIASTSLLSVIVRFELHRELFTSRGTFTRAWVSVFFFFSFFFSIISNGCAVRAHPQAWAVSCLRQNQNV